MTPRYKAYDKKQRKFFTLQTLDFFNPGFEPSLDDIILVKLTGRFDKNDIEIREGHILNTPISEFLWHVKFGEFQYAEAHSSMIGFYIECSVTKRTLPLTDFNRHEIVGDWIAEEQGQIA